MKSKVKRTNDNFGGAASALIDGKGDEHRKRKNEPSLEIMQRLAQGFKPQLDKKEAK